MRPRFSIQRGESRGPFVCTMYSVHVKLSSKPPLWQDATNTNLPPLLSNHSVNQLNDIDNFYRQAMYNRAIRQG